jgi:hypothetical protein
MKRIKKPGFSKKPGFRAPYYDFFIDALRLNKMTTTLDANNLVLTDVHHLLKLERQIQSLFASFLALEPLTEIEEQRLGEITRNFERYYDKGKILEGQVKFLFVSPLMWLSGFYHPNIEITLEEWIADIEIEDEDTKIKGRMDILAATRVPAEPNLTALWILVIETKKFSTDVSLGLPQLLTYAYKSLEHQESVWGLTTNGMDYQFVCLQKGEPSTYNLFPKLSLLYPEQSVQLLQAMKAICQPHVA